MPRSVREQVPGMLVQERHVSHARVPVLRRGERVRSGRVQAMLRHRGAVRVREAGRLAVLGPLHACAPAPAPPTEAARKKITAEKCMNMRLLLHEHKHIYLGLSAVSGWGAFLKDGAKKNELLGEYTGSSSRRRRRIAAGRFTIASTSRSSSTSTISGCWTHTSRETSSSSRTTRGIPTVTRRC